VQRIIPPPPSRFFLPIFLHLQLCRAGLLHDALLYLD
jgi:hypothetical protein